MDQNQPLVCKTHTTTYIGIFIIAFIIGSFGGSQIFKLFGIMGDNTYEAGWSAAKARLASSPNFGMMINTQGEVKTLSGIVEKVQGSNVSIKINPLEPLANPALDSRIVTVTSATKVTRMTPRDPKEVQKEMEVFMKSMQTLPKAGTPMTTPVMPPSHSAKQDAAFADIKVGDSIMVTTAENIRDSKEFTAMKVQIN